MRRAFALFALALVSAAGLLLGFASAASEQTTGTVTACATATTPAHTVGIDGKPVHTLPGDVAEVCETATYTVPTVTETVLPQDTAHLWVHITSGGACVRSETAIASLSGGTTITPFRPDSGAPLAAALGLSTAFAGTVSEGPVITPWYTTNDEIGVTNAFFATRFQRLNILPRPITLRPGEGLTLKQITSTTVGLMGALAVVVPDG
jgi:hypothetical protein